ncbi:Helix-turn-helix domain containing protein [uncultured Caudovirales phage]|uniref:Helix-turn-helix domain containing protein n=1 Tax=uncultured Caudovirales phage TaxID=2100421 RepID=A0A6J5PJR9_9CAUD|nr:Helix-turn-helix domain containing protein [uncultured Caudovirales phage]CAB4197531.1 Helix-turn-helix domain containing protein [uncultured Caudovirales phage]
MPNNTTTNNERRISTDTGPFAIVPEWLLDMTVSDRAVRLYALLSRYADSEGYSWPSRRTLARRLHRSVDALDRAVKELVDADVLEVEARFDEAGDRTSNGYIVKRVAPATLLTGSRENAATGSRENAATGSRESAALMRDSLNESHLNEIAPTLVDAALSEPSTEIALRPLRDLVWDSLMMVCGIESSQITKSSRGAYNRAVKDLKEIGATEAQIVEHAFVFRKRWPEASLTPTALARRWAECDPERQHGTLALDASEQHELGRLVDAWQTTEAQ